jgi:uncharacterized coiled-coil protein SlyX
MSGPSDEGGEESPVERRVMELEIRVAYQDDLIAQLDGVVRELGDRVVEMRRELADLRLSLPAAEEEGEVD